MQTKLEFIGEIKQNNLIFYWEKRKTKFLFKRIRANKLYIVKGKSKQRLKVTC